MSYLVEAAIEIVGQILLECFVRRPYGCLLLVGIVAVVGFAIYWFG